MVVGPAGQTTRQPDHRDRLAPRPLGGREPGLQLLDGEEGALERGEVLGVGLFSLGMLLLAVIPFIDLSSKLGKRARIATYIGLALLFGMIFTTIWGYWEV